MSVELTPLGNRVIVERDPAPEKVGNILIPDNAKEPPKKGTVIAIGPGLRCPDNGIFIETSLQPGERIMFGPYVGVEVAIEGDDGQKVTRLIMREDEVLAKLSGEDADKPIQLVSVDIDKAPPPLVDSTG
jgi:chaperonin GroES